jgi:predicted nucleic acid-binding protein
MFSIINRYMVMRGLFARGEAKQLVTLDQLCAAAPLSGITGGTIVQAARIYADIQKKDELTRDADILIVATAITHGLAAASNNDTHFRRIRRLHIKNWLA